MNGNSKKGRLGNLMVVITIILAIALTLSSIGYGIAVSDKNNLKEKYDEVKKNYDTVNNSYNALQSNYNSLNGRYNSLQINHTNLQQNYTSLQSNYNSLQSQYNSLQQNYNTLQGSYTTIQSQYNTLQSNYNSLQSQHNSLQSQYNSLQSRYNTLNNSYTYLQLAYSNLQSNYTQLNDSYNSLQNNYDSLKSWVEVRYGWEENATRFVTPNDPVVGAFKDNILSMYGTPSDGRLSWGDMDAIFDWIWNNTWYNYDTNIWVGNGSFYGDFWKYPNETLSKQEEIIIPGYLSFYAYIGDCEDFAVLMASLCKAEEDVNWLWVALTNVTDENGTAGHAMVFVNASGNLYIFDPTNGWNSSSAMSPQGALNEYCSAFGYSSVDVWAVFDENYYHPFNSNQEFFNFF